MWSGGWFGKAGDYSVLSASSGSPSSGNAKINRSHFRPYIRKARRSYQSLRLSHTLHRNGFGIEYGNTITSVEAAPQVVLETRRVEHDVACPITAPSFPERDRHDVADRRCLFRQSAVRGSRRQKHQRKAKRKHFAMVALTRSGRNEAKANASFLRISSFLRRREPRAAWCYVALGSRLRRNDEER